MTSGESRSTAQQYRWKPSELPCRYPVVDDIHHWLFRTLTINLIVSYKITQSIFADKIKEVIQFHINNNNKSKTRGILIEYPLIVINNNI